MSCVVTVGIQSEMSGMLRVAVVGDSFIKRVRHRIPANVPAEPGKKGFTTEVWGISGEHLISLCQFESTVTQTALRFRPDVIILHAGSNDLCQVGDPAFMLKVRRSVRELHGFVGQHIKIVLSEVLPRRRWSSWMNCSLLVYNRRVDTYNRFIRSIHLTNVLSWKHHKAVFTQSSYAADGVHLSPVGEARFVRSLRGAMFKSRSLCTE